MARIVDEMQLRPGLGFYGFCHKVNADDGMVVPQGARLNLEFVNQFR